MHQPAINIILIGSECSIIIRAASVLLMILIELAALLANFYRLICFLES